MSFGTTRAKFLSRPGNLMYYEHLEYVPNVKIKPYIIN